MDPRHLSEENRVSTSVRNTWNRLYLLYSLSLTAGQTPELVFADQSNFRSKYIQSNLEKLQTSNQANRIPQQQNYRAFEQNKRFNTNFRPPVMKLPSNVKKTNISKTRQYPQTIAEDNLEDYRIELQPRTIRRIEFNTTLPEESTWIATIYKDENIEYPTTLVKVKKGQYLTVITNHTTAYNKRAMLPDM
ncbi:hypothetical protein GWI33_018002 [Rhynchophorus ferrugineus]|uniref:Uncharacterized protein n=1 Tax=Rhynchophorus ferrugineus TaxID=354439 RepID=A0A834I110_RHYFE|nr:hypothetical protein GWI33_018002 [Rhynchophorus ferrugineus]